MLVAVFIPIEGKNVNVLFSVPLLERVEEFRWREKLASRTEAIRALVERGLVWVPTGIKLRAGTRSTQPGILWWPAAFAEVLRDIGTVCAGLARDIDDRSRWDDDGGHQAASQVVD